MTVDLDVWNGPRPGGAYEACAARIDQLHRSWQRGVLTPIEQEGGVIEALYRYFEDDRPDDDIDLLIDYARASLCHHEWNPLNGDRSVLDRFDRDVRGVLHLPTTQATLRAELDAARAAVADGTSGGADLLRSHCAHGFRDRFSIYLFRSNGLETIRTAADVGATEALADSVHPRFSGQGQLGAAEHFGGVLRLEAFNELARLAAGTAEAGIAARDTLVELTSYLTTAGAAVVRLPAHLLSGDHRARLLMNLDWWEELVARDPIVLPADGADRIPSAIRSVLWLANDATHLS